MRAIVLFLVFVATSSWAQEPLTRILLDHEIHTKGAVRSAKTVVVIVNETGIKAAVDSSLLLDLAVDKLTRSQISATSIIDDFEIELKAHRVSDRFLVSPKLVIEVDTKHSVTGADFSVRCTLTLIDYRFPFPTVGVPSNIWSQQQDITGISNRNLETNLMLFVQKSLSDLILGQKERLKSDTRDDDPKSEANQGYALKWRDYENHRNQLLLGVTAGTPALANLYLGFSGARNFPILVALSGMYYGDSTSGFEADVAWNIIYTPVMRHAVGLAFTELNEKTSVTASQIDPSGNVTTTTDTTTLLRPYLGPTYSVTWNGLHVEAGVGYKLDPNAQSSFRFLIQVGFTPAIHF